MGCVCVGKGENVLCAWPEEPFSCNMFCTAKHSRFLFQVRFQPWQCRKTFGNAFNSVLAGFLGFSLHAENVVLLAIFALLLFRSHPHTPFCFSSSRGPAVCFWRSARLNHGQQKWKSAGGDHAGLHLGRFRGYLSVGLFISSLSPQCKLTLFSSILLLHLRASLV